MSGTSTAPAVSEVSSAKMLRAMVGIGVMCALLIVLTFEGTRPRIEQNKAAALEQAIFKVLPGATAKQTFLLDEQGQFVPHTGEADGGKLVYAGYDASGDLTGIAVEAAGMGFADILRIIYGYDPEAEQLVGFYVLESKETPGLGDKIEKDERFLANFDGLDVSLTDDQNRVRNQATTVKQGEKDNPWEIDGITGATISSRAIGDIIGASTAEWLPVIRRQMSTFEQPKSDSKE